jgi:hypothetical protein
MLNRFSCPGSALFLFKLKDENGQVKRYLHTGDFRACPRQILHSAIVQPQNPVIDILYLDTTYLSPQYCFPAQEQVVNAVIRLVRKAAKRGELIPMKRNNGNNVQGKNKQSQMDKSQLALDKWFKKTPGGSFKPEQSENVTKAMDIANSCAKEEVDLQNDENDDENIDIDEMKLKNSKILVVVGTYLIGKEKVFFGKLLLNLFNCPSFIEVLNRSYDRYCRYCKSFSVKNLCYKRETKDAYVSRNSRH